ncbi:MAG: hypothetical protein HY296_00460 [Thaumarchaeota archaeon]|nr:hypothetical protein [Nitrososphaerota archaeon]
MLSVRRLALALAPLALTLIAVVLGYSSFLTLVLSSIFFMGTQMDLEGLAKKYIDAGFLAAASTSLSGMSGIKHIFAFAVTSSEGVVQIVADTALSVSEVDEVKVLGFFAKVFDVKPRASVLCVSPRLSPGAAELARQYGIVVLENEKPAELLKMLSKIIDKTLGLV